MKWQEVMPVVISILVIILVAILEKQNKLAAAITATMPLAVPLSIWIVYASTQGDKTEVENFTRGLMVGIVPSISFIVVVWLAARLGLKLVPIIVLGYAIWGLELMIIFGLKKAFGW